MRSHKRDAQDMPVQRLSAEDLVMLWADRAWPQDIGALAVLDGEPSADALRTAIASRLELVPRFRQVLRVPDERLGGPYWADDDAFDVDHHVRTLALRPPADEAALLSEVDALRRTRLDPSRPLWEMWLLTGLSGGRTGLFVRTHHSIADGVAGIATLASFLDTEADATPGEPAPWVPEPPPSDAELEADERRRRDAARRARLASLAHPVRSTRRFVSTLPALRELFAEPRIPATSLNRRVGAGRELALVRSRFDAAKAIAHANGAKVNDVLLTAISGGLRRLLLWRGEEIPGVMRIYVPVSLRHGRYSGARGNSVAQMVVGLPTRIADPVAALRWIAAETSRRKARVRPSVGGLPSRGIGALLMLNLIDRQHVNVESADLPGSRVALYLAGVRLAELFPILPLIGKVSLGVGAISYAGAFDIGVVADPQTVPDVAVFADGLRETLALLEEPLRKAA